MTERGPLQEGQILSGSLSPTLTGTDPFTLS